MKDKLSKHKHMVVTHGDFDGIASVVNVYNIIENPETSFQYFAVGYHSIDKVLKNLSKDTFDILWVLDLNLTKEQIDLLKNVTCKKIIWIDHHHYDFDVKEYIISSRLNCSFFHDESKSACIAVNDFITHNWPEAQKRCESFCVLGDIYDMWRKESPDWNKAYAINDLFWEYRYEKFFKKFKDGYSLDQEDKETITRIHKERNAYTEDTIENHLQFNEEAKIAYVLNPKCQHINHITLVYPANFYVIMKEFDDKRIAYSVRVYDLDFNLTLQEVFAIIKKEGVAVNTSGGHEKVGGIEIPFEENQKFLETINKIFEGKLK
jgi:oligoribonuclease NrnB/cAMP/cGMP phosphodiesterase (DHH superfamily)